MGSCTERVFQDIQTTYQVEPDPEGGTKEANGVTKSMLPGLRVCGLAGTPHIKWPTSQGFPPLLLNKGSCGKAVSPWHDAAATQGAKGHGHRSRGQHPAGLHKAEETSAPQPPP